MKANYQGVPVVFFVVANVWFAGLEFEAPVADQVFHMIVGWMFMFVACAATVLETHQERARANEVDATNE